MSVWETLIDSNWLFNNGWLCHLNAATLPLEYSQLVNISNIELVEVEQYNDGVVIHCHLIISSWLQLSYLGAGSVQTEADEAQPPHEWSGDDAADEETDEAAERGDQVQAAGEWGPQRQQPYYSRRPPSGSNLNTNIISSLKGAQFYKFYFTIAQFKSNSIQAFFGRFSATVTNSSWRNLEFFKKILEFFRKFLEFIQKNGNFFQNSLNFPNFKL